MTMQIAIPAPTYFQINIEAKEIKYYFFIIIPNPDTTSYKE